MSGPGPPGALLGEPVRQPGGGHRGGVAPEYADFFYPNIWPEIEGFKSAVTTLFQITNALAGRMMSLVAVALGLEATWFDGILEPNASTFAINHYPPRQDDAGEAEPALLFAEHADGNTLTILHQRGDVHRSAGSTPR